MSNLTALQERLGYTFTDPSLLQLALTHPSVSHESARPTQHNQRLEFLGDSVLGLVLTAELYGRFPSMGEGPLTKARAQMVNRKTLAERARALEIGQHLLLSHGEELSGGSTRQSSLSDAFEAVLGAVFIDGGFEVSRTVILRCFREDFGELTQLPNLANPKGELQELLQTRSSEPPRYEMFAASGPDHDREFQCAVFHQGLELGRGAGKSKKSAESQAALVALERLKSQVTEAS